MCACNNICTHAVMHSLHNARLSVGTGRITLLSYVDACTLQASYGKAKIGDGAPKPIATKGTEI